MIWMARTSDGSLSTSAHSDGWTGGRLHGYVRPWGGSRFPEILFKISLRGARRKISRNLHSLGGVPGGVMTKVTDIPSTGLQYGTPRHPASASLDTCTGLIPHTCSLLHPCRHPYTYPTPPQATQPTTRGRSSTMKRRFKS